MFSIQFIVVILYVYTQANYYFAKKPIAFLYPLQNRFIFFRYCLKYISILKQPKGINYICILNLLLSNDTGKSTIR